jgi:hypothetical protein
MDQSINSKKIKSTKKGEIKMENTYTHISIILDRSGSMASIRDDTIGGFNAFLDEQERVSGSATLTLVQFDTQDPYEVIHQFEPISEVEHLTHHTYVPRAATPLYDAIGKGIVDLDTQFTNLKDSQKPSQIVFVIITDGYENSSREFNKKQILDMIKKKQDKEDWQFVFLGAEIDPAEEAYDLGIMPQKSIAFDKTKIGTTHVWHSMSKHVSDYRQAISKEIEFNENDRNEQEIERKKIKRDSS